MTIASEVNRSGPYIGNGVTTIFDYEFRVLDETHIRVVRADNGIESDLTLGVNYSVTGVGDNGGGTIVMATPPTATQTLTFLRAVPFTQETDLENQGPFFAETIEAALDLAVMRDQQLAESLSRTIQIPATGVGSYDPDQLVADVMSVRSDRILAQAARLAAEDAAAALGNALRTYDTIAIAQAAAIPLSVNNVRVVRDSALSRLVNRTYVPGLVSDPGSFADANGRYWKPDFSSFPAEAFLSSRAALAAASMPPLLNVALCFGYDTAGDCGQISYKRVATKPLYGGVRSADRYLPSGAIDNANGGWWLYVPGPEGIDACAFGVKADWDNTRTQLSLGGGDAGATDNRVPLQNAMNFASMQTFPGFDSGGGAGATVLLPKGTMMISNTIIVPDGVILKGTGVYSTIIKMANGFPNANHFCIIGTPGDAVAICALQTRASAGALSLNGTTVVDGVAQLLTKRVVSVYSTSNNSGINVTITGTDGDGQPLTETKAGPNNGAVDYSFYNTVTSVSVSGAVTGNISVGNTVAASFGARVEEWQSWSNHTQAVAGTAMFYSNNAQHTGGLYRMKIFSGNRSAIKFETGVGGASLFTLEDIECGNYGNALGVASNNPCIYLNYAGLLTALRRVVVNGGPVIGGSSIGIQVDGGAVYIQDSHVENYGTGIVTNIRNINNGMVTIQNFVASGGIMDNAIKMDSLSTTTPHLMMQGIVPNGAPTTFRDLRAGGVTISNFIVDWVKK